MGIIVQFPEGHRPVERRPLCRRQFRAGQRDHSSGGADRAASRPAVGRTRRRQQRCAGPAAAAAIVAFVNGALRSRRNACRLRWLAAVAAFGLLTGCGTYGDFGRVRPTLVNDDTHAWMGPAAARGPAINPPWRHQLTDEERTLRDLAYPLIEPPYDRNKWYSVIGELAPATGDVALSRSLAPTRRGCSPPPIARRRRATTS